MFNKFMLVSVISIMMILTLSSCNPEKLLLLPSSIELFGENPTIQFDDVPTKSMSVSVMVKDRNGNPLSGATVGFSYSVLDKCEPQISKTNEDGIATTEWRLIQGSLYGQMLASAFRHDNQNPSVSIFAKVETGIEVTDYDGNKYTGVKIGNQIWMANNLRATHYANGDSIPFAQKNEEWELLGDNNNDKAFSYYQEEMSDYYDKYQAAYYTNSAATNGSHFNGLNNIQGICPNGWHLPGNSEWQELTDFLGGDTIAGGKMIYPEPGDWIFEDNYQNWSGFSSRLNGYRSENGYFYDSNYYATYWSSNQIDEFNSEVFTIEGYGGNVYFQTVPKSTGHAVRCIKD